MAEVIEAAATPTSGWMTIGDAADYLRVSRATIYGLCDSRQLRHARIGRGRGTIRIFEEDLERYLNTVVVAVQQQPHADISTGATSGLQRQLDFVARDAETRPEWKKR